MSVKKGSGGGGSIVVHNSELYSELMRDCTQQQNEEVVDQKQVRLLQCSCCAIDIANVIDSLEFCCQSTCVPTSALWLFAHSSSITIIHSTNDQN